jgi:hypothetical protein
MVLWGFKTEAAFDVWSVEHLMMGVNLAYLAKRAVGKLLGDDETRERVRTALTFLLVLGIALLWENAEHYIEAGLLGERITYWFQGVEHWSNRLITDNLMVLLGCYIFGRQNKAVWFARVFSAIWVFFHVFIFPHSMYLHTLF